MVGFWNSQLAMHSQSYLYKLGLCTYAYVRMYTEAYSTEKDTRTIVVHENIIYKSSAADNALPVEMVLNTVKFIWAK